MKSLGWYLFFALLLADVVAVAMLRLSVPLKSVATVSALVFIILAVVMLFADSATRRSKRREAEATARIAELQSQMDNRQKKTHKPEPLPEKHDEPPLQNS